MTKYGKIFAFHVDKMHWQNLDFYKESYFFILKHAYNLTKY